MKVQFNRAVRINKKVYAAGSVHDISEKELEHPHFKKFGHAGALEKFVEKKPRVMPKATVGKVSPALGNPSAIDGRVKSAAAAGEDDVVVMASATAALPEVTIGDDGDEAVERSTPASQGKNKKGR